ncbi:unnamed protein product [Parajaminaea phylloscopi]
MAARTTTKGAGADNDDDGHPVEASGPSSPSRRQPSRRRSSVLRWQRATSGESPAPESPNTPKSHDFARQASTSSFSAQNHSQARPGMRASRPTHDRLPSAQSTLSDQSFAGGAVETYEEARRAFGRGTPSPYFMAAVSFLVSLVQGLPLASMFKVYTFLVCEVYDRKVADDLAVNEDRWLSRPVSVLTTLYSSSVTALGIPAAPELPHPPQCSDPRVQKTTSAYAATMETVGALVALVLLNRVTKISRRIGRKPLLLVPQITFILGFTAFRLAVALPEYLGIAVLFVALVTLEASAAGPLKVGLQSYVVDTTSDSQRATALGFIDGFGQIGAFPSSTLGGFLAAITGEFFAPFYASVALAGLSFFYILVLVPESKKHRHHTFIDDWEHSAETEQRQQVEEQASDSRRASYRSQHGNRSEYSALSTDAATTAASPPNEPRWRRWLQRANFLQPLGIFMPHRSGSANTNDAETSPGEGPSGGRGSSGGLDFRLLNLAFIVVFEEVYQVFMVPMLLLYNSDVFGFDVLQNGYIVSLLQGVRALFLTVIFPPAVSAVRRRISAYVKRRQEAAHRAHLAKEQNRGSGRGEQEPLLASGQGQAARTNSNTFAGGPPSAAVGEADADGGSSFSDVTSTTVAKAEERGKFDILIMVTSYAVAAGCFALLALSRRAGQPWIFLPAGVIGLQLASGATSVRTALIVNSVSEKDQGKSLAANQVLCSAVYASFPLVTSLVYGLGLSLGMPELVWIFKAAFAAMACLGSLCLFLTHRGQSSHHHNRTN